MDNLFVQESRRISPDKYGDIFSKKNPARPSAAQEKLSVHCGRPFIASDDFFGQIGQSCPFIAVVRSLRVSVHCGGGVTLK